VKKNLTTEEREREREIEIEKEKGEYASTSSVCIVSSFFD